MEIGETLYVKTRKQWRTWLEKNHGSSGEIWLIYYKVHTGKVRIPYNDAVEEALCFGWIDSTVKTLDEERIVQRFTPRKKNSNVSEMNKERIRRLIASGKMTPSGLEKIRDFILRDTEDASRPGILREFVFPEDILDALKADPAVWNNFKSFPEQYKTIRIGWIDGARKRPDEFQKRLRYFIKMTAQNKRFGMVQ